MSEVMREFHGCTGVKKVLAAIKIFLLFIGFLCFAPLWIWIWIERKIKERPRKTSRKFVNGQWIGMEPEV